MLDDITARPYFLRAFYDWCVDTKRTPHILAHWQPAQNPKVPSYLSADGKIIFNLSPTAVRCLRIGKDGIFFTARFLGQTVEIALPLSDVAAIYAQETGKGLSFPEVTERPPRVAAAKKSSPPNLRVI